MVKLPIATLRTLAQEHADPIMVRHCDRVLHGSLREALASVDAIRALIPVTTYTAGKV